jgi:NADH:ubiquinone oxidoreductase subunit 5 (subunit L)/multisubunit Na+/H+ antiporter MnhA subunit
MKKIFDFSSTLLYFIASLMLVLISLLIMWWSIHEIFRALHNFSMHKQFILTMLQSIGTVIISIAILDISKYMIEEEVFRNKELREAKEARRTLTKIMTIIAIAVSIEGLVYIFKAGTEDLKLLIYPSMLILTSVLVTIGLGLYQKLTSKIEE